MDPNYLSHHGVLGMKWGVRRYQNKDGSLTPAGKKRYDRDVRENLSKKKENRIDTSNPDPKRWAKEDLSRAKTISDESGKLIKTISKAEKDSRPKAKRMDLSNMTDKELRDRINREILEQQYNNMFGQEPALSRGRRITAETLAIAGGITATASSALAIALAIKQLKG